MMEMSESQTVISSEGKILLFGLKDFLDLVSKGKRCFICGESPASKEFNDEHIFPKWIQKKFDLSAKHITLPNKTLIKYGQYKIPCCRECNTLLGDIFEKPISNLFSKSYIEIIKELKQNKTLLHLLFKWLCLFFFKTHFKDNSLLAERDLRKEQYYIGNIHYWEDIHHIHCIARSHYTNAIVDKTVYGSIVVVPSVYLDKFDYCDHSLGKGILLNLGEFSIISVLNDSCAGVTFFSEQLRKISGPLIPPQMKEILAHLCFVNLNLKEKPLYHSLFTKKGQYVINATIPEPLHLLDKEEWVITSGNILRSLVYDLFDEEEEKELILNDIENGKKGFLFDDKGNFIDFSK